MLKRKRQQNKTQEWDGFVRKGHAGDLVLDAATWSNLPPELQLKILEHLPLPALIRCQVVCKGWYKSVRNIDQVTVHGDCYVAFAGNGTSTSEVTLYSSRHEQTLLLRHPQWHYHGCTTRDGLLYFDDPEEDGTCLYNIFTRKKVSIPHDPIRDRMKVPDILELVNVVGGGCRDREHIIVRIVRDEGNRKIAVFKTGHWSWETSHLQLPAGEEVSASEGASHATIEDSILYFVTVNVETRAMSVRWMDLRGDLDGTSTKLVSFPSLPSCYTMYMPEHCHDPKEFPDGPPFTGNIAVVGARLFMACLLVSNPAKPRLGRVALFSCDKQEKRWDLVSEMPSTGGFVAWRPDKKQVVELWSQGDKLVFHNHYGQAACIYNTSTKAWSPFPGKRVRAVCPLKLSMRF